MMEGLMNSSLRLCSAFLLLLVGCSLINDADEFRALDGSADGGLDAGPDAAPACSMDEQCAGFLNAAPSCDDGECVLGMCAAGFGDCDDVAMTGCETSVATPTNCGSCGVSCESASPLCEMGECVATCSDGLAECDGACVDLELSSAHCGACGNTCEVPEGALMAICDVGVCDFECNVGQANCDEDPGNGCEVDTSADAANCGMCGAVCEVDAEANVATATCAASACVVDMCLAGFTDCDGSIENGCEVQLADDPMNCGGCGVMCADGIRCVSGTCDPYEKVSTQWDHTCALRQSGAVDCWGNNESQEGNGGVGNAPLEAPSRLRWTPPGAAAEEELRARDVSVGNAFTCFVSDHEGESSGRLYCSGSNSSFRRAGSTGSPNWPPQPVRGAQGTREFVRVELGAFFGCAIDVDGDVWCFGANTEGQNGSVLSNERFARQVPFSADATEIALSYGTVCAALTNRTVECVGANETGQLGRGSRGDGAFPVPAPVVGVGGTGALAGITRISANATGFCAIDEDDDLLCWGRVGLEVEPTPTLVAEDVSDVAIFNIAFCWVELSGEAWCRGRTLQADFGDGITGNGGVTVPQRSPTLDGFSAMDGGYRGGCALDAMGELRCWGYSIYGTVLRESLVEEVPAPVVDEDGLALTSLSNVAMGTEGTCAVSGGSAYCWGSGGRTDFGNASNISYAYAIEIPGLSAVTDVARSDFGGACAIGVSSEGSGLHCWSTNSRGRLGDVGEATTGPALVPGVPSPTSVDMAAAHTCAIVAGDEVMCWGANERGQIGQPAVDGTSEPPTYVELDGERIQASHISVGGEFGCAILVGAEAGQVVCWGAGALGQLGHGASVLSSAPVRSMLTDATSIEAGSTHICAIAGSPAQVFCWGAGAEGQRGDGTANNATVPTAVAGSAPEPVSVAAGYVSSCAAYADDSVRCWGDNTYSQLGVAGAGSLLPQLVPGLSAQRVAAGSNQDFANCAGTEGGAWQCWGLNDHGKLGTSPDIHFTPQEVTR